MDAAGLSVLLTELNADCEVARAAATSAATRLKEGFAGSAEACAYELNRLYNVIERMLERISEDFENHFEKRGEYHERLLQRLTLDLPGIRPAFVPQGRITGLRELKGFRHLVRHAYDLTLRRDRLIELAEIAQGIAADLPSWCQEFGRKARAEHGWL